MKSTITSFLLLMILVSVTFAQSKKIVPEGDVSLGIEMNTTNNNQLRGQGPAFGPVINYAIDKDFHIGTRLGFAYVGEYKPQDNSEAEKSYTKFSFAPYGRYFFKNIRNMRPFIKGELEIASDINGETKKVEGTTNLNFSAGGAWYPFNNVGVYGGVRFFNYNIDDGFMMLGIGEPYLGIEWYL